MIQKELRRQHQKGNVIPLKLWTLCSAIMQALKLKAANGEAVSCSLKKADPLYEDVPVSEEKEGECEWGASPRPPPKPPDDSTDSSTETDRDVSSGEDSDSVESWWFWKYGTKHILGNAY